MSVIYSYKKKVKMVKDQFMKSRELFNPRILSYIINNAETFKSKMQFTARDDRQDPFVLSQKYLKKSINGEINVLYKQNDGFGRFHAVGSLSMQTLPKPIRHSIARDYYMDIDIQNAHPTIAKFMCEQEGIETPFLDKYIAKPEKYRNLIASKSAIGKIIYLSLTNGGSEDYKNIVKKSKHVIGYKKEMKIIHDYFAKKYPEQYEENTKKRIGSGKWEGTHKAGFFNSLLCDFENKILMKMHEYFGKPDDCVLCYDGIMLRRGQGGNSKPGYESDDDIFESVGDDDDSDGEYDLEGCENFIREIIGIKIKLVIKLMDKGIDVSDEELEEYEKNEILYFDPADNYYWLDFIKHIQDTTFDSEVDFETFWKKNINRVLILMADGEMYLKYTKEDPFRHVDKFPKIATVEWKCKKEVKNKKTKKSAWVDDEYAQSVSKYYNESGVKHVTKKNDFTFDPSEKKDDRNVNLWTGFQAELTDGELSDDALLIINHMKEVWAGNNDVLWNYICSWFHNAFKYPWKKTKKVLVLRSEKQQIGKGIIIEEFLMPYVYGDRISKYGSGIDFITTRFNQEMMNRVLIVADELASQEGGFNQNFDILKGAITSRKFKIEIKGGRKFDVDNYMNFIFLTNHDFTIKVEHGDNRYAIFDCDCKYKGNTKYFNKLASCFNQQTANEFFTYFYNLENAVDLTEIPQTKIREDMQYASLSLPRRFVHQARKLFELEDENAKEPVDDFMKDEDGNFINLATWQENILNLRGKYQPASKIYEIFNQWREFENESRGSTLTKFGNEIKKDFKSKRSNGTKYLIG